MSNTFSVNIEKYLVKYIFFCISIKQYYSIKSKIIFISLYFSTLIYF